MLLPFAGRLHEVNEMYSAFIKQEHIIAIADLIPDEWLQHIFNEEEITNKRQVYIDYLTERLSISSQFTKEAQHARETLI